MLVNSMYCMLVSGHDSAIGEVCAIAKFGIIAAICLCDCIISAKISQQSVQIYMFVTLNYDPLRNAKQVALGIWILLVAS